MGSHTRPIVGAIAAILVGCSPNSGQAVEGSGTIEVVEVDVSPLVAARVLRVWVDEGHMVRRGDTLATLTQSALPAEIETSRARLESAEAALRDLKAGARPAEVARAEADLLVAETEASRTGSELTRARNLMERNLLSQEQLDAASSAAAMASSKRDAARESLSLVRSGARTEHIRAARADVEAARASLSAIEATASDLVLTSPIAGSVLVRHVEPGEVIGPGIPALTVGEVNRPWIKIYVAARDLPDVRVGDSARVRLDGALDSTFTGLVVSISDRAEFTPRVALTEDERADLVFAVKVQLSDSTGTLKPGLPATVTIASSRP